jgi:hypothetical protein
MKKILVVLLIAFVSVSTKAQESKVTTFHRMLILNKENKLLVIKFNNKELWVTPGLYQNSKQTIKQGIDSIAATYGITIYDMQLRGVYGLKNTSQKYYSTRNMFIMKTDSKVVKLPKIIGEIKWLSLNEANKLISFPHINSFIKDVFMHPKNVRSGVIERFNNNKDKQASRVLENFYNIN